MQLYEPTYNENCSQYDGICSVYLRHLPNVSEPLTTTFEDSIFEEEQPARFSEFLEQFSSLISEKCSVAVMPFICQYVYPPCDDNGSPLLITEEQCVNIRDDVCANEWRIAMATELGTLLPTCEAFESGSDSTSVVVRNDSDSLQCHYQFRNYCGVCIPLCGTFSQYPDQVKFTERGFIILSTVLAIIGGTMMFIAAIIRRKQMCVHITFLMACVYLHVYTIHIHFRLVVPQVLVMYSTTVVMLVGKNACMQIQLSLILYMHHL